MTCLWQSEKKVEERKLCWVRKCGTPRQNERRSALETYYSCSAHFSRPNILRPAHALDHLGVALAGRWEESSSPRKARQKRGSRWKQGCSPGKLYSTTYLVLLARLGYHLVFGQLPSFFATHIALALLSYSSYEEVARQIPRLGW